tara:strand:- start:721 stop:1530 length:810 start_codon:yes stop_codon:yes gene_type:complete
MKAVLLTGNHPRHIYLINLLNKNKLLNGVVMQTRENHFPEPDENLPDRIKYLHKKHFSNRLDAENEIFGYEDLFDKKNLSIKNSNDLNDSETIDFINNLKPKLIISFGIDVLSSNTITSLSCEIWNLHGGLSPDFKGAITHFWPTYLLKPQFTGCTIHLLRPKIDAGEIIHQTGAVINKGDNLHMLSCKTLKEGFYFLNKLIKLYLEGCEIETYPQKRTGKLWQKKDWSPYNLELIYDLYDDSIVDLYIDGKLGNVKPYLITNKIFDEY